MTTRQFHLNSRSGWIEHHHVDMKDNTFVVPREGIIPVGPGDYSPNDIRKHIRTPNLSGSGSIVDSIVPHKFGHHSRISHSDASLTSENSAHMRMEQSTIFHDYHSRQPIDTSKLYCATPGPTFFEESILDTVSVNGKRKVTTVDFTRERRFMDTSESTTHYDIQHDSKHLKPTVRLGSIQKERRLPIKLSPHEPIGDYTTLRLQHHEQMQPFLSKSKSPRKEDMPVSPIKMPKIKQRFKQEMTFDASCYTKMRKDLHVEISPGAINKIVPKNIFGGLMAVPKTHASRPLNHSLVQ